MDVLAALEISYDSAGAVIAELSTEDLDRPTACPGWDVRAALDHMLGVVRMFDDAANGAPLPDALPSGLVGDDPSSAFAAEVRKSLETWRRPGILDVEMATPLGVLSGEVAAMLACMEVTAHSWDIAHAVGREAPIDPAVAVVLLPFVEQLPLDDFRAAGEFGPAVPVAIAAPERDRLLGLLGRQP